MRDLTGLQTVQERRTELIGPRTLDFWTDKDGFVGNKQGWGIDCGDSAQRAGFLAIAEYFESKVQRSIAAENLIKKARKRIEQHMINPGLYVRRPGPGWMGRLNTTSGDQIRPLVIAMGYLGMRAQVWAIFWRMWLRLGFYWNTRDTGEDRANTFKVPDWSGPEHLALFVRALWPTSDLAWLVLQFLDLFIVLGTLNALKYAQVAKNTDQLNRMALLLQGVTVQPTLASKLAMYLFRKYRPTWDIYVDSSNYRIWQRNDNLNPGQYVLDNYFWNLLVDPPIERTYWRNLCAKYFERP